MRTSLVCTEPPPRKPPLSRLADLLAEAAQQCQTLHDPEILRLRVEHVQNICDAIMNKINED